MEPTTEHRYRARTYCRQGKVVIPVTGPLIMVDNKLYNDKSTSFSARTDILPDEYWVGNESDVLSGPPGPTSFPLADWWIGWKAYARMDSVRDILWLTEKPALKYCPQAPLSPTRVFLPPDAFTGDRVNVVCEQCSDSTTRNFPYYRDRGVSINNAALISQHGSDVAFTYWVKATKWNRLRANSGVYYSSSIADTKYIRIDILGLESMLISGVDNTLVIGYNPTPNQLVGAAFTDTVFAGFMAQLDQYQLAARDKASRGVMDVMVTLVELPKTIKLVKGLRHGLKRVRAVQAALEKKKISSKARTLSQLWLEGRYGWRQILFDAQGLMRLFNGILKRYRRSYTSGTSLKDGMWFTSDETDAITFGYSEFTVQYLGHTQLRAGVATVPNLTDTWYKKFYHLMGGFNPVTILWEVTKLSWIIDWFVDIGSLITPLMRDPARYARAWHTLDMPYEQGTYVLRGSLTTADIGSLITDFSQCPVNGFLVKRMFNHDEEVVSIQARGGPCKIYFRVPQDTSRFPLVVPQGILIKHGSQIVDILSVFSVLRR
jgi:hypothetical protein